MRQRSTVSSQPAKAVDVGALRRTTALSRDKLTRWRLSKDFTRAIRHAFGRFAVRPNVATGRALKMNAALFRQHSCGFVFFVNAPTCQRTRGKEMRTGYTLAAAWALCLTTLASANAFTPQGKEGVDWARISFNVENNRSVEVTATAKTRNAQSGNTTKVQIWDNDRIVWDPSPEDRAYATGRFTVRGNGRHDVIVQCTNQRADAESCSISYQADSVIPVR